MTVYKVGGSNDPLKDVHKVADDPLEFGWGYKGVLYGPFSSYDEMMVDACRRRQEGDMICAGIVRYIEPEYFAEAVSIDKIIEELELDFDDWTSLDLEACKKAEGPMFTCLKRDMFTCLKREEAQENLVKILREWIKKYITTTPFEDLGKIYADKGNGRPWFLVDAFAYQIPKMTPF